MATTSTPNDLQLARWRAEHWTEYVRTSGFKPYMGRDATAIIHTCYEMTPGGKSLTIPLLSRLANQGVEGNTRLSGSEEPLGKHSHSITVAYRRNAIEFSKQDERYDAAQAYDKARPLLTEWSSQMLRDSIIDSLCTVSFSGVANSVFTGMTPLVSGRNAAAAAATSNTWVAANSDRVLFGKLVSNYNATFATALATIDNTDDKLTANAVGVMKRIAKTCDPHIRPIRTNTEEGREYYVMFVGSVPFRDLKSDSTIIANNRDARAREGDGMNKNPLFQDGDLIHDGVIIREIPEIPVLSSVGASSINVGPAFLCGAQSVAVAWGQEPKYVEKKEDDYGFFTGVGIEECLGVNKVMRKHGTAGTYRDHGMVTGFFAAVGDA